MADVPPDRQAALRALARAHRALLDDGLVSTEGLLPAWRALRPAAHPGAARDVVDVGFIAQARARYGADVLRAQRLVIHQGHARAVLRATGYEPERAALDLVGPPRSSARGELLALVLGLGLEAAKLRHGLPASPDELRAAFASPADARAALDHLAAGGAVRHVEERTAEPPARLPGAVGATLLDGNALAELARGRPVYVLAGRGALRAHDLLSPWARRLRDELRPVGKALGAPLEEEPYAAIEHLGAERDVHEERLAVEAADGFEPLGAGVVGVRCEALAEAEVDRRCREAAHQLRRARALLVIVPPHPDALERVLTAAAAAAADGCRVVAVLDDGTADMAPAFVEDTATGHVLPTDNAFGGEGVVQSVPAMGFHGAGAPPAGPHACELVTATWRARARVGAWSARVAVRVAPADDLAAMSRVCIETLTRLGHPHARARR